MEQRRDQTKVVRRRKVVGSIWNGGGKLCRVDLVSFHKLVSQGFPRVGIVGSIELFKGEDPPSQARKGTKCICRCDAEPFQIFWCGVDDLGSEWASLGGMALDLAEMADGLVVILDKVRGGVRVDLDGDAFRVLCRWGSP